MAQRRDLVHSCPCSTSTTKQSYENRHCGKHISICSRGHCITPITWHETTIRLHQETRRRSNEQTTTKWC